VPGSQADYVYRLKTFSFSGAAFQQFDFEIPIIDDNLVESDEVFEVGISVMGLTSPRKVTAGPDLPVEIRDDDYTVVSIHDEWIRETDALTNTVGLVHYTLNRESDSATTLVINHTPGTALAGTDYNAAIYPLTVTIPPNTTSGTFSVQIINDAIFTGDRTFSLTVTAATPAGFTTNQVRISVIFGTATIGIEEDEWW
jgi:hypothetical protein